MMAPIRPDGNRVTGVGCAVMYVYSPLLTMIVLLSIPLYVGISVLISPGLRSKLEEKFRRGAENQSFLVESVTGIGTLKAMAVVPQMRDRWEKLFAGYTNAGFDVAKLANWGSLLIQLVSKLTTVAILYFGAKAVIAGDLTVGALVAFNMLSGRVAAPILRLSQLWQDFQQVRISVDRLGDVLNAPAEPEYNPNRASLPPIAGVSASRRVSGLDRVGARPCRITAQVSRVRGMAVVARGTDSGARRPR